METGIVNELEDASAQSSGDDGSVSAVVAMIVGNAILLLMLTA
jgi:hypothetical protein